MIAEQASRVLNQLAKIADDIPGEKVKYKSRDTKTTASIARAKLHQLKENIGDVNKVFSVYDTNRRGRVSHEDFAETLVAANAGLRQSESIELANQLDISKTGSIAYRNIFEALQEVENKFSVQNNIKPTAISIIGNDVSYPSSSGDHDRGTNVLGSASSSSLADTGVVLSHEFASQVHKVASRATLSENNPIISIQVGLEHITLGFAFTT